MLLEALIWHGFSGPARLSDEGLDAIVRSVEGASTMAFVTDNERVREALELIGLPCCDGLFLSVHRRDAEPRVVVLLLEFKGADRDRARTQLMQTLHAVKRRLQPAMREDAFGRTRFHAIIISDHARLDLVGAPTQRDFKRLGASLHVRAAQRWRKSADLTDLVQPGG